MGNSEFIALGGGCFWCTEAVFKLIKGVIKTTPGYAGGQTENPTYSEVCSGNTGHAETLLIEYDPAVIKLDTLLNIFFDMHDPTSKDRQENDVGSQYRSVIFYTNEEQKNMAQYKINNIKSDFDKPILTKVEPLKKFYEAEDNHKDYYAKNPINPYCAIVIVPKLHKIKKKYAKFLKE
ncbi:MAG: peptide methionine sulfoxide reductase [Candidatus Parvarchaeum acidophilus ARMAN-5]|jgi:peptide-methionine (S)-S-oxide reductase|uniref:Peptide methionine sulfoxide reductase MsrA n=1 Tax=Candidatus Parvarchaeum acidophilus ARMAN-5 TaxID=662762 RepID=D6GVE7_PARA5|nr:MAG: peptide methionine sulfoxide reductase [Candidatus Parvarchaeum acidophilus ARMAN-5]